MNKLFLIITMTCCSLLGVNAQLATVELSPPLNQNNRMSLNDLLQFYVHSNTDDPTFVYLQLAIERQNFGLVSVLKTDIFELADGISPAPVLVGYNGSKLQMISTRIGYENIKRSDFVFPDGNYNYCIELRDREGVLVHKDCAAFETVNPVSFFLIYPFDHQEVKEDRPVFTWTPMIIQDGRDIDYRIRWVEKDEKANANNVFYNTPNFFQVLSVEENLLPYKIEYPEFDPEKYYYWQVEAFTGRTILAKSDIWEFYFSKEKPVKGPSSVYVKVDLERFTKTHLFKGDFLNFEWINNYKSEMMKYKILDHQNKEVISGSRNHLGVAENGNNYFQLNVSDWIKKDELYTLVVLGRKRNFKVKFKKIQ